MSLAGTPDQRDLAAAVAGFAARAAGTESTRAALDDYRAGRRTETWERLTAQGLHAVHLPADLGGGGAGLPELAVVTEQLGRALFPGPFLPTAICGLTLTAARAATSSSSTEDGAAPGGLAGPGDTTGRGGVEHTSVRDNNPRAAHPPVALDGILAELIEGATAAVVDDPSVRAATAGDGWRVDGTTDPVLGLPGAEVVVVGAYLADGARLWFRLRPAPSASVETVAGVDPTRSAGRLRLDGHEVAGRDWLPAPPAAAGQLALAAVVAAEAAGIAGWLLDTAVEHARVRRQFGQPIGAFQAVQHKAALMIVRAQAAAAAAWDAARASEQNQEQQALAAAQAALVAAPAAVDVALDCVSLLGAIGFTWEHDAQLYWRRALGLAVAVGPEERWARRLGELSLKQRRDFSLVSGDAYPGLRGEIRAVLDEVTGLADDTGAMTGWGPARGGPRRARLAEAGLVAPHYPAPYGWSAGPEEQAVIAQELARRGIPPPTTVIGEWVLPTLLEHGTEAQRARFVAATLRGEIVWCQLFSEPGAGSDLAGLATRATKVDGGWLLSGQKAWNSYAHEADWGVCLARSEPDAPRHAGISYFLVDMHSPGVDVRPIRQATGRAEFNEVFLDDVLVPDDCLVGGRGAGWRLAGTTLANERVTMGAAFGHGSAGLVRRAIADRACAASEGEALRVLGRCVSREMVLSALSLREALARVAGTDPGPGASVAKVYNALAQRDSSRELIALLGPLGLADDQDAPYADDHIGLPAVLFGGGTIEIQLTVIARRVLGLPGGPR